jgi:hypothetical protein
MAETKRNRAPRGPATVSGDRDEKLKILAAALMREMGYWTQISVPFDVPLYAQEYKQVQATDLDVVGVLFDGGFAEHRLIAECKSGEDRAMEELLKLAAVVRFFEADRGWLVKTRIHENARHVAGRLRVQPLALGELTILAGAYGLQDDAALGREAAFFKADWRMRQAVLRAGDHKILLAYCDSGVWLREYFESIHNLIYMLEKRGQKGRLDPTSATDRYLVIRAAVALGLCILRLTSEVVGWNASESDRGVELFLFGGPSGRRQREGLLDGIKQIVPADTHEERLLDPPFLGDLKDMVRALIRNARWSQKVLPCLADVTRLFYLETDHPDRPHLAEMWDEVTIKLSKDVVDFSLRASGLSAAFGAPFLTA